MPETRDGREASHKVTKENNMELIDKTRKSKHIEEKELSEAFKGVWIPSKICLKKNLSAFEQKLLSIIDALSSSQSAIKTGGCYATNGYLATLMVTSKESVGKTLTKLRKKGYIKDVKSKNKKYPDKRVLEVVNKKDFPNKKEGILIKGEGI